jgi:hypothetical protein
MAVGQVTLTLPREEIRTAWRAAVLGYRRELRATHEDRLAWPVAYAAFREVLPDMPEAHAKHETTHAIAFAAANHTAWFWGGVYGDEG